MTPPLWLSELGLQWVGAALESTVVLALVLLLGRVLRRLSPEVRAGTYWLGALKVLVALVGLTPLALPLLPSFSLEGSVAALPAIHAERRGAAQTERMKVAPTARETRTEMAPAAHAPSTELARARQPHPMNLAPAADAPTMELTRAGQPHPINLTPAADAPSTVLARTGQPHRTSLAAVAGDSSLSESAPGATSSTGLATSPFLTAALAAFACVFFIVALFGVTGLLRRLASTRRILRDAVPATDGELLATYHALALKAGLKHPPTLFLSDRARAPFVSGALRPALVLPRQAPSQLSLEALEMALAHELSHVRRGDLWMGWIPALADALLWFHPLARALSREYLQAREEACDAAALRLTSGDAGEYGGLLLAFGVVRGSDAAAAAHGASPAFDHLKRRLERLQHVHAPRTRFQKLQAALALCVVLVLIPIGVGVAAPNRVPLVTRSAFAVIWPVEEPPVPPEADAPFDWPEEPHAATSKQTPPKSTDAESSDATPTVKTETQRTAALSDAPAEPAVTSDVEFVDGDGRKVVVRIRTVTDDEGVAQVIVTRTVTEPSGEAHTSITFGPAPSAPTAPTGTSTSALLPKAPPAVAKESPAPFPHVRVVPAARAEEASHADPVRAPSAHAAPATRTNVPPGPRSPARTGPAPVVIRPPRPIIRVGRPAPRTEVDTRTDTDRPEVRADADSDRLEVRADEDTDRAEARADADSDRPEARADAFDAALEAEIEARVEATLENLEPAMARLFARRDDLKARIEAAVAKTAKRQKELAHRKVELHLQQGAFDRAERSLKRAAERLDAQHERMEARVDDYRSQDDACPDHLRDMERALRDLEREQRSIEREQQRLERERKRFDQRIATLDEVQQEIETGITEGLQDALEGLEDLDFNFDQDS